MITFITDQLEGEVDLLFPVENKTLVIKDLDKHVIAAISSRRGRWSHDELVEVAHGLHADGVTKNGADAYLGDQWIGSTEV